MEEVQGVGGVLRLKGASMSKSCIRVLSYVADRLLSDEGRGQEEMETTKMRLLRLK